MMGTLAEPSPNYPSPLLRRISYSDLYSLVADLVSALLLAGLKPGDRVASYCSNSIVSLLFSSQSPLPNSAC